MKRWFLILLLILLPSIANAQSGFYGFSIRWNGQMEFKSTVEYQLFSFSDTSFSLGVAYLYPRNIFWGYLLFSTTVYEGRMSLELGRTSNNSWSLALSYFRTF